MSDNRMMTTTQSFTHEDISHKPKRLQSDNLRKARGDSGLAIADDSVSIIKADVPQVVTLERAIEYYKSHASGEHKALYVKTAEWLEVMLSKSIPVTVNVNVEEPTTKISEAQTMTNDY